MRDRGRMREPGAGTADRLRNGGMRTREAAYVQLVEHRVGPRHARADGVGPNGRRRRDCFRNDRGRVAWVLRQRIGGGARERGVECEAAVERARVGIDEQLRRIEAVSRARIPGAVRTQPVARAGDDAGHEAVKDVARSLGQAKARGFQRAVTIEQAQLDRRRVA